MLRTAPTTKPYAASRWGVDEEASKELPETPGPYYEPLRAVGKGDHAPFRAVKRGITHEDWYFRNKRPADQKPNEIRYGERISAIAKIHLNRPEDELKEINGWKYAPALDGNLSKAESDWDTYPHLKCNLKWEPKEPVEIDFGVRGATPYLDPDEPVEPWHLAVFPEEIKTFQLSYDVKDIFADASNF